MNEGSSFIELNYNWNIPSNRWSWGMDEPWPVWSSKFMILENYQWWIKFKILTNGLHTHMTIQTSQHGMRICELNTSKLLKAGVHCKKVTYPLLSVGVVEFLWPPPPPPPIVELLYIVEGYIPTPKCCCVGVVEFLWSPYTVLIEDYIPTPKCWGGGVFVIPHTLY